LTIRIADRDVVALRKIAKKTGVSVADAARRTLRLALSIPSIPKKTKKRKE